MNYALIGNSLSHSFSKRYFSELFSKQGLSYYNYSLHEVASLDGLRQWIEEEGICGFNVTSPFKQTIVSYLDCLSPTAEAIGAVNCVSIENSRLVGYNTDAPAFQATLEPLITPLLQRSVALILGTGGAARAISHALQQLNITHRYVSRTPDTTQLSYTEAARLISSHSKEIILINATPVGMIPLINRTPWPFDVWPSKQGLVYDLIYNPAPTQFLQQADAAGCRTINGLSMLHLQADFSWEIWQKIHS